MSAFNTFLKSGHSPTLFAAFLYVAFSCAIWVLNGAMAPFTQEAWQLTASPMALMLTVPIVAGALMRFPLCLLAQYIGRKAATLVEMGMICAAMLFGLVFVSSFNDLLAMGVLLGIAGASFGVALSLGAGSFPAPHKGLAWGLVGAGNIGTAVSVLGAPPLAQWLGSMARVLPLQGRREILVVFPRAAHAVPADVHVKRPARMVAATATQSLFPFLEGVQP